MPTYHEGACSRATAVQPLAPQSFSPFLPPVASGCPRERTAKKASATRGKCKRGSGRAGNEERTGLDNPGTGPQS